jgi:FimV-like protein
MGRRTVLNKSIRKQIKQPDELESGTEQIMEFIKENPERAAAYVGAVLVAVGLVFGGFKFVQYRKNSILAREGEAVSLYQEARTDRTKISEAVQKLEKLYEDYPGTVSGQLALYDAANLYYVEGNVQKAMEKFRLLSEKHADNATLKPLVLRDLAYAYEQTGNYQAAIDNFLKVMSDGSGLPKAQGKMDLARVYEEMGDKAKAQAAYREVVDSYGDSPWAGTAREKLGLPPVEKGKKQEG